MKKNLILTSIIFMFLANTGYAKDFSYKDSTSFSSDDYLLKENSERRAELFERYQVAELGVSLESGISCGSMDLKGSIQSSLKGLLDGEYFKGVGQTVASAGPMMLFCWQFPGACSILKNFRLNSSIISKLNLSKCALVDKFIDSRTKDWEFSRQQCMRSQLRKNGRNMNKALEACEGSYSHKMANWAGQSQGEVNINKLIESSAKWAGFQGKEASRITDLTKAFVGDTELVKGQVSVNYGSHGKAITPRSYKLKNQKEVYTALNKTIKKIDSYGGTLQVDDTISQYDLEEASGGSEQVLVDRDTIRSIYYLPYAKREAAMRKLSSSIAMRNMAIDANKSLDLLLVASQNPNLPKHRKIEIEEKRRALKESLELAILLDKQKNEPVNTTLSRINRQGEIYRRESTHRILSGNAAKKNSKSLKNLYFDCSDGFMCDEGSNN